MQQIDVTAELSEIELFPDNTYVEIIQNVKTILATAMGTVPLDRDFGIDTSLIDLPMSVIKPLLIKEVKEKIEKYEPRVKFVSISWDGDGMNGSIIPSVKVAIK